MGYGFGGMSIVKLSFFFFFFFLPYHQMQKASHFPDQGWNPCPPVVEAQSLNCWTTRNFPEMVLIPGFQHLFQMFRGK